MMLSDYGVPTAAVALDAAQLRAVKDLYARDFEATDNTMVTSR